MASNRGECRSCGAPIIWARTSSGKMMPVDAEPVEGGTLVVEENEHGVPALVGMSDPNGPRYRAHFASCPDAESWRRRGTPDSQERSN